MGEIFLRLRRPQFKVPRMARISRVDVSAIAPHVIQRCQSLSVFRDELDREFYLSCLGEVAATYQCRIHTYVLMTNPVHLLLTGISKVACRR